ncbi:uncharacterized protein [Battus philenor]|uniref:uncharacterized protein n=1 Tax=Battus philenor TaxID=42288 RepID=UPI0035CF762B
MVNITLFLGFPILMLLSLISTSSSEPPGRACYHAKICVHNAIEKCGIDSKGNLRRFIDSCDIKEYNCLKRTDFVKTSFEKCKSLPPLKDDSKNHEKVKNEQQLIDGHNQSKESSEAKQMSVKVNKSKQNTDLEDEVATEEKAGLKKIEEKDTELRMEEARGETQEIVEDAPKANNLEDRNDVTEEGDGTIPGRNMVIENNDNSNANDVIEANDDPESNDNDRDDDDKLPYFENENADNDEEANDNYKND